MGLESALGPAVPDEILQGEVGCIVKSDDYQLLIISSKYKVASDKVNKQIDEINQERIELGELLKHPVYTGGATTGGGTQADDDDAGASDGVTITIR